MPLIITLSTGRHCMIELLLCATTDRQKVKKDVLRHALLIDKPAFIQLAIVHGTEVASVTLLDGGQNVQVARRGFDSFEFTRRGAEPYEIEVLGLTYRELRQLDRSLPCAAPTAITDPPVPPSDVLKYTEYYRHFPTFADADL